MPVRVAIADDDETFRDALRDLIVAAKDLHLVGEAVDAVGAITLCQATDPDVAVVDVAMPGGGPAAVRGIRESCPQTVVVALSAADDLGSRRQMQQAGVVTYLVKGIRGSQLLAAIRAAGHRPPEARS